MRKVLTIVLLVMLSALGWANGEVKWTVAQIEGSTAPGAKADVKLEAEIKSGWHLYSVLDQTKPDGNGPFATLFEGTDLTVGTPEAIVEQPLIREKDKGFNKDINFFRDKATFWVPITIGPKGVADASITVTYQVCNNGICIPPQPSTLALKDAPVVAETTMPAKSPDPVSGSEEKTPPPSATGVAAVKNGPIGEKGKLEDAEKGGLLVYLWVAILAGFTALLTPCVFPMIPITVSFFSKQKKEGSGIKPALLYCAGIIGTFTVLGMAVSILFGATGLTQLANNPWVNLLLAAIFIVLALSLFGVFELGLPSKFVNKFDSSGKSELLAPVLMGLTFSLTSFTCTLPFVGAVLVGAANGKYFYPIVGMLGFSTAFCLPFFLLALFPQALAKLPKSGAWMVTVKAYMGFIELIAAVKFLSTFDLSFEWGLITREMNLALWFLLLVFAAAYLFGWIRLPKVHDGKIGPLRLAFGVGTLLLALWIGKAFNGGTLGQLEGYLPPSPYPGTSQVGKTWNRDFVEDYDAALAKAKENGKPIFIDFTGQFCTNCRVMENTIFPSPQVQKEFEKFNKVSLYTDRVKNPKYAESDTKNSNLQQKLVGTVTLPTYVVVSPDGSTVLGSTPFLDDVDGFTKWLSDHAGS
ncbi:MAG: thioredoxin family protein [Armatimonadetes bacterium]|nr:thioredoxin family protein [Armatimonadota bacterium]